MTFTCDFMRNNHHETEEIEAETMQQAAEIIKKKYDNITYLSIDYHVEESPKMYAGLLPKVSGDNIADFLAWAAVHVDYPPEVPNNYESIGQFVQKYMGKSCDKIPFLFVEDHNGNIIDYYVFTDADTLRHEHVEV